jgi:hypothetical protein
MIFSAIRYESVEGSFALRASDIRRAPTDAAIVPASARAQPTVTS